jgi:hypothetical protein
MYSLILFAGNQCVVDWYVAISEYLRGEQTERVRSR